MIYQQTQYNQSIVRLSDHAFIPLDPANTDYAKFKRLVLAGEATIEGMTPTATIAYVETLP